MYLVAQSAMSPSEMYVDIQHLNLGDIKPTEVFMLIRRSGSEGGIIYQAGRHRLHVSDLQGRIRFFVDTDVDVSVVSTADPLIPMFDSKPPIGSKSVLRPPNSHPKYRYWTYLTVKSR